MRYTDYSKYLMALSDFKNGAPKGYKSKEVTWREFCEWVQGKKIKEEKEA